MNRREWIIAVAVVALLAASVGAVLLLLNRKKPIRPLTVAEVKERLNPDTLAKADDRTRQKQIEEVTGRLHTLKDDQLVELAKDPAMWRTGLSLNSQEKQKFGEALMEREKKRFVDEAKEYFKQPPDKRAAFMEAQIESRHSRMRGFRSAVSGINVRSRFRRSRGRSRRSNRSEKERVNRILQAGQKYLNKTDSEERAYLYAYMRELREHRDSEGGHQHNPQPDQK